MTHNNCFKQKFKQICVIFKPVTHIFILKKKTTIDDDFFYINEII